MEATSTLKEAVLWKKEGSNVRCFLCSWRCLIAEGRVGHCRVRKHVNGALYSLVYNKIVAANPDPIEKKPLFHFQPGTKSFSIATAGCNFQCGFCQNWQISQMPTEGDIEGYAYSPSQIVRAAIESGCSSIAYTYTEPTIFMELCSDTAMLAKRHGLSNIFVSNGYMTKEAVDFAKGWLDAINIDLKSFSEDYYKNICKAHLEPVLQTITYIAQHTSIWMELTTLIVPGQNDSDDELRSIANFIAEKVSVDVPWHISRFYPMYKMDDIAATSSETLQRAYNIGKEAGLRYVYIGNMPGMNAESTYCHNCGRVLIERFGYTLGKRNLKEGKCIKCQSPVAGVQMG